MPAKFNIPNGTKFGRWTIIREVSKKRGERRFLCKCSCESHTKRDVALVSLTKGRSSSCGCYGKENAWERFNKNGLRVKNLARTNAKRSERSGVNHPFFDIHRAMKGRCHNPENKKYKDYGGRGIKICSSWKELDGKGFWNFVEWATVWMMENEIDIYGLEIDRIDNDGNYEPNNCRWVTRTQNNNNTRANVRYLYKGQYKQVSEILESNRINMDIGTFRSRLERGWSVSKSLTTPIRTSV